MMHAHGGDTSAVGAFKHRGVPHHGGEQLKLQLDRFKVEEPISGLPERRKRPHAFGAPSIEEFQAAIGKHQTRGKARKGAAKAAKHERE